MNILKPKKSVFQYLYHNPEFRNSKEYQLLCNRIGKPMLRSFIKVKSDFFLQKLKCLIQGKFVFYENLPSKGKEYYSQKREELIIRSFFQDRRNGVFLDVGCAWPFRHNTTCYLEQHLGWSGLAVDANPANSDGWQKIRTNTQLFNYIVSDHSGTIEKFYRAGGLGSIRKERPFNKKIIRGKEIEIPTITLSKLLDDNNIVKINFLSIDIEGSEMKALTGFDINRFAPNLVCIEFNRKLRPEILAYFESHNYKMLVEYLQYDKVNRYFVPKQKVV